MKRAKTGGRTAGTPNHATKELREKLQGILQTTIDELPDTLAEMGPNDRAKLLTALLPYILPKLTTVDITAQAEIKPLRGKPAWLGGIAKRDGLED
ncbi:hypothetical protein [Fibrivirga algicola]|uniref:Uncharacterized protein n=1 Tax=Fibrivirga algicola TaxID=2950420 RepID=A0ABX0QKZ5_9BACT|nr:hypothetical protein [Fibrivirga algicola]NID11552.1 hypothetical protein [Fibrivirga algicola]